MNMDTVVKAGHRPWLPSDAATDLVVWAADDAPTVGTFRMGTNSVLFVSVSGVERRTASWAYVALSPADAAEAEHIEFDSYQDMWSWAMRRFEGRDVVIAGSVDLELEREWMAIEGAKGLYQAAMQYLQWSLDHMKAEMATVTRRPGVDLAFANPVLSAWVDSTNVQIEETESEYSDLQRLVDSR